MVENTKEQTIITLSTAKGTRLTSNGAQGELVFRVDVEDADGGSTDGRLAALVARSETRLHIRFHDRNTSAGTPKCRVRVRT